MPAPIITLAHGNGGTLSWELVALFERYFAPRLEKRGQDAAELTLSSGRIAFTTDSFVISPIFFPGGDIGKLAVCGTVNDLLTAGAEPRYLSCALILEEGLPLADLERIVVSMARTAVECGVEIVTGDTKVVGRGAADRIFINTTGIGTLREGIDLGATRIRPGDRVLVTGTLGDHGCSVLLAREAFGLDAPIISDCAPLRGLIEAVLATGVEIHALRDPTRGGAAATLNEFARQSELGIVLDERAIPVNLAVQGVCELLGLDPLYLANEGKMLIIAPAASCEAILSAATAHPHGYAARLIGEVVTEHPGRVVMRTALGRRILEMPVSDPIPRIC
jgi:hydrogenase expression/formation protein HypE